MAKQDADKSKQKPKSKPEASDKEKQKKLNQQVGAEKEKKKKPEKVEAAAEVAAPVEKAPEVPRPPADPRLKFMKKFHGKFLPKGPLRDRLKVLMTRWESGEDHGNVTVEELKSVFTDWKTARTKPPRPVKV